MISRGLKKITMTTSHSALHFLSFQKMLDSLPSQHLPDVCASIIKASYAEKVQVLDAVDLTDRFKKTLPLLIRQIEVKQQINTDYSHQYMATLIN